MNSSIQPFSGEIRPGIKALVINGPSAGKVVDVIEDLNDHIKGDDLIYNNCIWQVEKTGRHFAAEGNLTADTTRYNLTVHVRRLPFHVDDLMPMPPLEEAFKEETEEEIKA